MPASSTSRGNAKGATVKRSAKRTTTATLHIKAKVFCDGVLVTDKKREPQPEREPETMPPQFREDSIIVIAPGSQTTWALGGLPESYGPPSIGFPTRMFKDPREKGKWSPYHLRLKPGVDPNDLKEEDVEEDQLSTEGAIWPIEKGIIVDMDCFKAFLVHVHRTFNQMSISTPVLLVTQPYWGRDVRLTLTDFLFEALKIPGLWFLDSAIAAQHGFAATTALIVDIGYEKTDITPIVDHLIRHESRIRGIEQQSGRVMTENLLKALAPKGFTYEKCEQLKKSGICQVLLPGTPILKSQSTGEVEPTEQAAAGANGASEAPAAAPEIVPEPVLPQLTVDGDEEPFKEDEGVLDVASLVTGDKMAEFLAQKEKEKAEKVAAKSKKASDAAQAKLAKAKVPTLKDKASFTYVEPVTSERTPAAPAASTDGPASEGASNGNTNGATTGQGDNAEVQPGSTSQAPHSEEIEVGSERFMAVDDKFLQELGWAIYRAIHACEPQHRARLWEHIGLVGQGSKIKGLKEALYAELTRKYLISPSSATMFTSELPSNFSTPTGTGANTPMPSTSGHAGGGSLLQAATIGQATQAFGQSALPPFSGLQLPTLVASGQTPTKIGFVKIPDHFSTMKENPEQAAFLGAQVAAKGIFTTILAQSDRVHMSRQDFNDNGPAWIGEVYCYDN